MILLRLYQDRCYRIGQTKPVTVYKLYAGGTVDEDIYELGEKKQQLTRALLSEDDANNSSGGSGAAGGGRRGRGKRDGAGGGELSLISMILQRALAQKGSSS